MNEMFVAGMVVGWVLGALTVFLVLLGLAWREEQIVLRAIRGGIDDDDE